MTSSYNPVGVIGAGYFGTAVANLLAHNTDVLLYSRRESVVNEINTNHRHLAPSRFPPSDFVAVGR